MNQNGTVLVPTHSVDSCVRLRHAIDRSMIRRVVLVGSMLAACTVTRHASAHHEAIFGPQSSLVLSAPGFVSVQGFTKNLGTAGQTSQETTFVLSGGVTPFSSLPVSFALTLPASVVSDGGNVRKGFENAVFGVRYRLDFQDLQRRWGKDGNFAMAIGAVEPPTGTMDYSAFRGPFNYLAGVIVSLERGVFGTSFFSLYRREGPDSLGDKKGDEVILGGGVAYTPLDHPGRMLSFQLGMSEENHRRSVLAGQTVADSGGYEWMLTPAIVCSPHPHLQLFGLFSFPLSEGMRDETERSRWRAGLGIVYLLDAEKERAESM
jgi:hypothetical protein